MARSSILLSQKTTVLDASRFDARPGTYALVLSSEKRKAIQVGKLGTLHVQPGFYVYVGSAFGPGGVRARLAHHMSLAKHPHWHIDYLRMHTTLKEVWYRYNRKSQEHKWAICLAGMKGRRCQWPGLGRPIATVKRIFSTSPSILKVHVSDTSVSSPVNPASLPANIGVHSCQ
jgi:Uri superfamily endonuclease